MYKDYNKVPRPDSVRFFQQVMSTHDKVKSCKEVSEYYYNIKRVGLHNLNVLITNYYTIGYADYLDIIANYPNVNAIITMSNWNGYTEQVKEIAKNQQVGIFVMKEFMGALNINECHEYIKYDDEGKPITYSR